MPRCVVVVLDSGGIGALPDAATYGDAPGANTIGNVARAVGGLAMPNFARLGLGALGTFRGVAATTDPVAYVARLRGRSVGKDTVTGHWEMAGIITDDPFPTYPDGFPPDVVSAFANICGRAPLGNRAASGTDIVAQLGPLHQVTGRPLLYTSADSVFQVAAHEEVVPLERLHAWCAAAREMLVAPNRVNRVIARPFRGEPGAYVRTPGRRDFAVNAPCNVLDRLAAAGTAIHAVGKISDIFSGRAVTTSARVDDNAAGIATTLELMRTIEHGLIFTNLNDFDSKYGHRRDPRGYAAALERLDVAVPDLESALRPGDALIFTADHGCDPTAPGSDHTREYVPFVDVGLRRGLAADRTGLDAVGERIGSVLVGAA